mgnify:CR=1 FL=1
MRYTFEDVVLISDEEADINVAEKFVSFIERKVPFKEGIVSDTPSNETKYRVGFINNYTENIEKSAEETELFNHLLSLNLLPVPPNHDIHYITKVHEMKRGGKMAWHNDGDYSLAVTFYLSECVGGELEVLLGANDEGDIKNTVKVSPKRNRIVVLKGLNDHRVLNVKSGKRKSIQIFIKFIPAK